MNSRANSSLLPPLCCDDDDDDNDDDDADADADDDDDDDSFIKFHGDLHVDYVCVCETDSAVCIAIDVNIVVVVFSFVVVVVVVCVVVAVASGARWLEVVDANVECDCAANIDASGSFGVWLAADIVANTSRRRRRRSAKGLCEAESAAVGAIERRRCNDDDCDDANRATRGRA